MTTRLDGSPDTQAARPSVAGGGGARCPVCGDDRFRLLGTPRWGYGDGRERFTYQRCRGCAAVVLLPLLSPAEYERLYTFERPDPRPAGVADHRRRIAAELRRSERRSPLSWLPFERYAFDGWLFSGPPGAVLDIGCGDGTLLLRFARRGWDIHGVDYYPAAIAALDEAFAGRFQSGDASAFHFDRRFDVVVMRGILEHLPNPLDVLRHVRKYLAASGQLVIITPNLDSVARWVFGMRWFYYGAPEHVVLYDRRVLARLLRDAGYVVRRLATFAGVTEYAASVKGWPADGTDPRIAVWEKAVMALPALLASRVGRGSELLAVAGLAAPP